MVIVGRASAGLIERALADGARWVLAWDDAEVLPYVQESLFWAGATRFNLFALENVFDDALAVPARFRALLANAVVICDEDRSPALASALSRASWRAGASRHAVGGGS